MNLGQVARMERRTGPQGRRGRLSPHVALGLGRTDASGIPRPRCRAPRRRSASWSRLMSTAPSSVARAARRLRRSEGARLRQDRHAEHRRHDRDRRAASSSSAARSTAGSAPSTHDTGALLWETPLDASAHATPMTFLGRDGRQYVVDRRRRRRPAASPPGSNIVAFALPHHEP